MTYLQFFSSIVDSIAWPAAILLPIFWFRSHISGVITRLRIIRHSGTEVEFAMEAQKLKAEIEGAPNLTAQSFDSGTVMYPGYKESLRLPVKNLDLSEHDHVYNLLYRIAIVSTRAAIMEAFSLVEREMNKAVARYKETDKSYTEETIFNNNGPWLYDTFSRVKRLRDSIFDDPSANPDLEPTFNYCDTCVNLASTFAMQR